MVNHDSTDRQAPDNIPPAVRRLIRRARRRYWSKPAELRPALSDPRSYLGLFGPKELDRLARNGCWPLPAEALAEIAEMPAERRRRRREFLREQEEGLTRLLAEKGAAIRSILFAHGGGRNGQAKDSAR